MVWNASCSENRSRNEVFSFAGFLIETCKMEWRCCCNDNGVDSFCNEN